MVKDKKFYSEIGKKGIRARWDREHSKVRINKKLSINKIRINAYLCGDGYIKIRKGKDNNHYEISFFPDNLELANYYCECFMKEFSVKPSIKNNKVFFPVRIKNKPICIDLLSIGKYGSLIWEIPNLKGKQIREWIKCFFDCEAHVNFHSKNMQIKSVNSKGLLQINNVLNNVNIKSKLYGPYKQYSKKHNDYSMLVILGKENLLRYQKLINFNHPNKKCALNKLIKL